jgi:collagenase-like PrtC family protease
MPVPPTDKPDKFGTYLQKKRYVKKNGEIATYAQPVKRKLSGRRLTVEEIKEIEPIIIATINSNPYATLKQVHEMVNVKIAGRTCSISLIYRYMKCHIPVNATPPILQQPADDHEHLDSERPVPSATVESH